MNKALSCYREFSRAYIDDIAIFSKKLGRTSSSSGYYFNETFRVKFHCEPQKVCLWKAQIKYLGHIIGSGKHEPDPEKTAVINNLPVPKTKEFRSVLGLCNYYREYIPKYSELVYPLTELTKRVYLIPSHGLRNRIPHFIF
ncbi:transposon Ty3-I Gag-Pol polyprotein [Trichonephila clavipes]|nr:transposon Ty3-I Gag-Pol polyprotein [Trichonephila clavipes]